jgi:hypothetical protein
MLITFGYVEHLLEVLVGRVDLHGKGRHQVQQQQYFYDDFDLHNKNIFVKSSLKHKLPLKNTEHEAHYGVTT